MGLARPAIYVVTKPKTKPKNPDLYVLYGRLETKKHKNGMDGMHGFGSWGGWAVYFENLLFFERASFPRGAFPGESQNLGEIVNVRGLLQIVSVYFMYE